MTKEQAKLLARYCTRVLVLFDSDAAGLKATFRAADVLLEEGLHPAVVTLPPGEDPDTVVRGQGPAAMKHHIDDALDVLDRKLQILEAKDYFSSIERTRSAVDRLLPTLRAATDPALRDIYVAKVADRTGVRRETLEAEIRRSRRRSGRGTAEAHPPVSPPARRPPPKLGAERQLLLMMVRGVEWVERAGEVISTEDFDDPEYRAIFQTLLEDPETRFPPPSMDPVVAQRFQEILSDPEELAHGIDVFTKSVNRMRVSTLDRRIQDLQRRIEAAVTDEEKLGLAREKAGLARELRELDPNYWTSPARGARGDTNPNRGNP
jgi:DNA primase